MKILVIGGTRFFGYHTVKRLLKDGHDVTLFNRGLLSDDFGDRVRRIHGDRQDKKSFFRRLKNESFDVVIDMIAFIEEDSLSAIKTFQGRIAHFIHISTGAVYVVTEDFPSPLREEDYDRPIREPAGKASEIWSYGYNKRKCEDILFDTNKKNGFPVTVFRLPIVVGERDHTLRAYSYFIRIQDGDAIVLPDGGLNTFTHIYQDDIVRTIAENLKNSNSIGQAFNLAQGEILTLKEFILSSSKVMNRRIELVDIPSRFLRQISLGLSFSPYFGRRSFIMDARKAKRILNFSSTPFKVWLEKTINWFMNSYKGEPPENYRLRAKELEAIRKYNDATQGFAG